MPIRKIDHTEQPDLKKLAHLLAQELIAGGTPDGPDIVEEALPQNRKYVTVIWQEFASVEASKRGKVILDAYNEAQGPEAMLSISAALGVTPEEAIRLGLPLAG